MSKGELHKEPTHDDPVSLDIDYSYLKVNILAILVYNHETGERLCGDQATGVKGVIVDITTVEKARAKVMPDFGNVPSGPPRLEGKMWVVPFRNETHGELQAFISDRPVSTDLDFEKAVKHLKESVGRAIANVI